MYDLADRDASYYKELDVVQAETEVSRVFGTRLGLGGPHTGSRFYESSLTQ